MERPSKESTMKTRLSLLLLLVSLHAAPLIALEPLRLESPDTQLRITFQLDDQGAPKFDVTWRDVPLVSGTLGLDFKDTGPLCTNLRVGDVRRATRDTTYSIPVGKASSARDQHHELIVALEETSSPHRKFDVAFRAFNDGVGFRYLVVGQKSADEFVLVDELTKLAFAGDPVAHSLPLNSYTTSYEKYYETMPVSAIGPQRLLGLPLLLERRTADAKPIWMAVTEANLRDYAGMYLAGVSGESGAGLQAISSAWS